jgi:hypothetical protein
MDNDPLVPLVIHDAPGVARIGVAALQNPVVGSLTELLQSTDFGAFIGSPVMAEKEQRHHACEMRNCKTRSCLAGDPLEDAATRQTNVWSRTEATAGTSPGQPRFCAG